MNVLQRSGRKKAEQLLKIEIDYDALASAYGHTSRPFPIKPGQRVAVRVISQFGEETTNVLGYFRTEVRVFQQLDFVTGFRSGALNCS